MLLEKERIDVMEYCKKLVTNNLTTATGGNISIYNEEKNLMAMSPSGMDYFLVKHSDVVVMDLKGNIIEGDRNPSSEYPMHSIFYRERKEDIKAVVHTHSDSCVVMSCLGEKLPLIHYLLAAAGGEIRCTKYEHFGTEALAKSALEGMKDRYSVLLGNHGVIAGGSTIEKAFNSCELTEFCARVYLAAKAVGEPNILSDEHLQLALEGFKVYGQK